MHLFKLPLAIFAAFWTLCSGATYARGGMTPEDRFSPDHISGLPPEVRQAVARVCGPTAHAEHYFAMFYDGSRLIKLHFEHAHCRNDMPLCRPSGCLHQEYGLSGGHYRLLRSYYGPATD
jgi:hypothetical protein